ncbi:MAG: PKD domain-containing protein [Flavobacteriales bacterium]|nr:PKD domain-containing protein [Flavobacteriales bacterium]
MRSILTPAAFLFSLFATAQSGPCDPFNFCFVPSMLPSGNLFLDNCSSGPANTQYVWTFGDGTSSTSEHAEHQYSSPGVYLVCLTAYWDNCSDSTCTSITIGGGAPCEAGFDVEMAWNAGTDGNVFFNATSNLPGTNFIWYFADGTEGGGPAVEHTYAEAGDYFVCVSGWYYNAATEDTCWTEDCAMITVSGGDPCDGLEACFEVSQLSGSGYFFNNCSSPSLNSTFVWLFGDGSTSTQFSPIHTFTESGVYIVCLVTTWPGGCMDETCQVLTVGNDPCADFEACFVTNDLSQPGAFFFDNCTNGQGNSQYQWTFGDGGTSTGTNVDHVYQQNGTYAVCLTAYYGNCVDSTCTMVVVDDIDEDPCDGLVACFEPLPFENGAYLFENCSQLLPIAIPASYAWNFGDGSTSTEAQPDHSFAPGTYTVCLAVTHGDCTDEFCTTLTAGGDDPCNQLTADFITEPNGLAIQFISTTSGPSPQSTFSWTFGDGTTGSGPNPMHDYAVQGVYEVCLHVVSIYAFPGQPVVSCEDDVCYTVDVGFGDPCDELVACFEPLPFENGAYYFSNCSETLPIDIPVYWLWDFGDGTTSDNAQPDHVFAPGVYTVCLTVTHGNCVDSTCTTIAVTAGPECDPNYAVEFSWVEQSISATFTATANLPTIGYNWTFGDGTVGYGQTLTQLYEPPGPFEVCVSAWYWNDIQQDTCWAHHCELVDLFDTGLGELDGSSIRVFPVPATDQLTIAGLMANTQVTLFTADGRLVQSALVTGTVHNMDVSGLAKGGFVLRLATDHGNLHRKVIVE